MIRKSGDYSPFGRLLLVHHLLCPASQVNRSDSQQKTRPCFLHKGELLHAVPPKIRGTFILLSINARSRNSFSSVHLQIVFSDICPKLLAAMAVFSFEGPIMTYSIFHRFLILSINYKNPLEMSSCFIGFFNTYEYRFSSFSFTLKEEIRREELLYDRCSNRQITSLCTLPLA